MFSKSLDMLEIIKVFRQSLHSRGTREHGSICSDCMKFQLFQRAWLDDIPADKPVGWLDEISDYLRVAPEAAGL